MSRNVKPVKRVNFEIENDDQTSMEVEVKATGAFQEVDDRGFVVPEAVLPGRRLTGTFERPRPSVDLNVINIEMETKSPELTPSENEPEPVQPPPKVLMARIPDQPTARRCPCCPEYCSVWAIACTLLFLMCILGFVFIVYSYVSEYHEEITDWLNGSSED